MVAGGMLLWMTKAISFGALHFWNVSIKGPISPSFDEKPSLMPDNVRKLKNGSEVVVDGTVQIFTE